MDLKKLLAKINSEETKRALAEYIEATSGENLDTAPELAIYLPLAPETARFFTKERLRLLRFLRDEGPRAMGELAEGLARNVDAVSRDVRFLVNMGVLDIERDEADERRRIVALRPGEIRMGLGSRQAPRPSRPSPEVA